MCLGTRAEGQECGPHGARSEPGSEALKLMRKGDPSEAVLAVLLPNPDSFAEANSNSVNTVTPYLINSDFSVFD